MSVRIFKRFLGQLIGKDDELPVPLEAYVSGTEDQGRDQIGRHCAGVNTPVLIKLDKDLKKVKNQAAVASHIQVLLKCLERRKNDIIVIRARVSRETLGMDQTWQYVTKLAGRDYLGRNGVPLDKIFITDKTNTQPIAVSPGIGWTTSLPEKQ
jgi:hypothetical protein